ncbi:MAG: Wzz/FepE/Etk N-terminal domain-containing protein [Motiliproteus sp.]
MAEQRSIEQHINQARAIAVRDDEVDLSELFSKIWQRKWWVVAITVVFTLLAIAYVLLAKPTYELKASIRPVLNDQFVELNQSGLLSLTPASAFDRFRKNLESRAVRRVLFDQAGIHEGFDDKSTLTEDQMFTEFDESLVLIVPVEKKGKVLVSDANYLAFQHFNPEYGISVVNRMLAVANSQLTGELKNEFSHRKIQRIGYLERKIDDALTGAKGQRLRMIEQLTEENELKIINIQDKLDVVRTKARARRFDRIEEVKEAVAIAQVLDIESPTTLNRLTQQTTASGQMAINTEVGGRNEPLYLRGTKLLSAELSSLQNRQSDDFTDAAIRVLESELELLKRHREVEALQARDDDKAFILEQITPLLDEIESLKSGQVDFEMISFSRVDQQAIVPERPIKPKKRLIVAVAIFLGGMLGLFVALVVPARKEEAA